VLARLPESPGLQPFPRAQPVRKSRAPASGRQRPAKRTRGAVAKTGPTISRPPWARARRPVRRDGRRTPCPWSKRQIGG